MFPIALRCLEQCQSSVASGLRQSVSAERVAPYGHRLFSAAGALGHIRERTTTQTRLGA